ncbi:MAG: cyanophycinase [Bacteroidota bacterium]
MIPKGKIVVIGGSEDKGDGNSEMGEKNASYEKLEILKAILPLKKKSTKKIEIITSASLVGEEIRSVYRKAFEKIGFSNIGFIDIKNRLEADKETYYKRIKHASAVLFSGGNQFRLATILGGTKIIDLIKEKYTHDKDFIIAGTSAGAMAIPKIMINEGQPEEALLDRSVRTSSGLGFLKYCIVDTHFIRRGRFGRLAHAVIINPGQLGVGLGEDTALIIKNGSEAECYGSGTVVIIDGKKIEQTNISDVKEGDPVFVENLEVHLLVKGCRFSLKTRKLAVPAISPIKRNGKNKKSK